MEQLGLAMHDQTTANPFGVPMEGPLQRSNVANKREPKIDDVGDIGRIGSRGGDGG